MVSPDDSPYTGYPELPALLARLATEDLRLLLIGQPGSGKSTLAVEIAAGLSRPGRDCWCLGVDPGSPAFGVPGAVCLAHWDAGDWQAVGIAAVCTLDAARFRLPLMAAVRELMARPGAGTLLIDTPGVVRGVAGAELLQELLRACAVDLVIGLHRPPKRPPLLAELRAWGGEFHWWPVTPLARRPGPRMRARLRTRSWDQYLASAATGQLSLNELSVLGTPPPANRPEAWTGRQCALMAGGRTLALGEVLALEAGTLRIRAPWPETNPDALLVRDARRGGDGWLETARPFMDPNTVRLLATAPATAAENEARQNPRPAGRVGPVDYCLHNGVFGDPLLHLWLRHEGRSLLFDLGDAAGLGARTAHRVTDIFVSHAHMDHMAGFLWLLRSRIGDFPTCRMFGPPGLATHVQSLVNGILWDRVAQRAPRFEVTEVHGSRLLRHLVQAGRPVSRHLGESASPDGTLLSEPGFRVRAAALDHGTPVLAFAFEPVPELRVRKDALRTMGLAPGAWLRSLKDALRENRPDRLIALPHGGRRTAGSLAADLILTEAPKRLVYATDFADTAGNRQQLISLARNAHTLFCEASFREPDRDQAHRTGHLTGRACGEIAADAEVARLVPFHFSRRYEDDPGSVYAEVADACARTCVPEVFQER